MPCKKAKRIRAVDVGKPGHHYIKVAITGEVGPRGGTTQAISDLIPYKHHKKKK
jgi:hypothetical protein